MRRFFNIRYIIALYIILRVLYWFQWAESGNEKIAWDIVYHINEKLLPISLFLFIMPAVTGWTKKWAIYGICVCVFMAVYSILCRYTPQFNNISDIQITGIFIAYSFIVFILLSLRR